MRIVIFFFYFFVFHPIRTKFGMGANIEKQSQKRYLVSPASIVSLKINYRMFSSDLAAAP